MLRIQPRLALVTLCLLASTQLAQAQQTPPAPQQAKPQPAPAQQKPAQTPPQLERIEPGSDVPTTTIPPREGTRINERRGNDGLVKEAEVQAGPSRYTVKSNTQPGTVQPGQTPGNNIRGPQWQVMEFDIGNPKKQDTKGEAVRPAGPQKGVPASKNAAKGVPEPAEVPPPPALPPNPKQ